jgi:hypothetical protein
MPLEPSQLSALLVFPNKRCSGMEEKEKKTYQDDSRKEQDRHTGDVNSHVHLIYLISPMLGHHGCTRRGHYTGLL